jgi:hypothetical protein
MRESPVINSMGERPFPSSTRINSAPPHSLPCSLNNSPPPPGHLGGTGPEPAEGGEAAAEVQDPRLLRDPLLLAARMEGGKLTDEAS